MQTVDFEKICLWGQTLAEATHNWEMIPGFGRQEILKRIAPYLLGVDLDKGIHTTFVKLDIILSETEIEKVALVLSGDGPYTDLHYASVFNAPKKLQPIDTLEMYLSSMTRNGFILGFSENSPNYPLWKNGVFYAEHKVNTNLGTTFRGRTIQELVVNWLHKTHDTPKV